MSPIRVAVLATTVHFGGVERVLLSLLEHMDGEVELVPVLFTRTDAVDTGFFDRLRHLGVRPHVIAVNGGRPKHWTPIRNILQTVAFLRTQRFDVIHSHGYRADVIALIVAKWLRLPVVSTCHGFISTDNRLKFYNWLDRRLLRYFTRVIAVSDSMKKELVSHGLKATSIEVVTNAVPVTASAEPHTRWELRSKLGIGPDECVFGYVGRLSPEKGIHYLLEAAAGLGNQQAAWRLLVLGDGDCRNALETLSRDRGILDRVHFVGFQRETAPWYAAMDVFVLPSTTEGTPMALLEAMVAGVPVIATSVGGVPAIVSHGRTGVLVNPRDVQALVGTMRAVAADSGLRMRLARDAEHAVGQEYDLGTWIRRMRALYVRVARATEAA